MKSLTYGKVRGSRRAERLLGIDCLFARFTDGGWAPIWRMERVLVQWAWRWGALTRVDQTDLTRPQSSLIIWKGPRNGCGRLLRHRVRRGPWDGSPLDRALLVNIRELKRQRRNKRKYLHKKRVQLPQDLFGTPTWPPFHCMATVTSCENAL